MFLKQGKKSTIHKEKIDTFKYIKISTNKWQYKQSS